MTQAATKAEISQALDVLLNSLPLQRGTDPDTALFGYVLALQDFPVNAIELAIKRILRGECDVNKRFCPTAPELASIVRESVDFLKPSKALPDGTAPNMYRYRVPKSKVIERNCTKQWARDLVKNGVHPKGSIWCPGGKERPDIGNLYGPDEAWERPVLVTA